MSFWEALERSLRTDRVIILWLCSNRTLKSIHIHYSLFSVWRQTVNQSCLEHGTEDKSMLQVPTCCMFQTSILSLPLFLTLSLYHSLVSPSSLGPCPSLPDPWFCLCSCVFDVRGSLPWEHHSRLELAGSNHDHVFIMKCWKRSQWELLFLVLGGMLCTVSL